MDFSGNSSAFSRILWSHRVRYANRVIFILISNCEDYHYYLTLYFPLRASAEETTSRQPFVVVLTDA